MMNEEKFRDALAAPGLRGRPDVVYANPADRDALRGHFEPRFVSPPDANTQVERLRARRELKAGIRRHRAASKLLTALETEIARMERSGKSHATTVAEAKSGATQAKNAQLEAEKHITMWREVLA